MRAASGFSRLPSARDAAREALALAGGTGPAWCIASHHHADSLAEIAAELGPGCILGTAYGALTEAGESEEEPGLAVLLVHDPELRLSFAFGGAEHDGDLGAALAHALGPSQVTWLFLDRESGWPESVAQSVPGLVAGAGTSGGWAGPAVWPSGSGSWAVGLQGATTVEWTLAQALAPLGGYRPVTRAVGDRLFTLGGRPAAQVALDCLGPAALEAVRQGDRQLYVRAPGERADRLFAVAGLEKRTQALFVPGFPEETPTAALAIYDGPLARAEFAAQLQDLRSRCPDPAFAVYVNCCARGKDLYGEPDVDAGLFRAAFPGVPLLGLSGSFELAPGGRLCSYTGVLIAVS